MATPLPDGRGAADALICPAVTKTAASTAIDTAAATSERFRSTTPTTLSISFSLLSVPSGRESPRCRSSRCPLAASGSDAGRWPGERAVAQAFHLAENCLQGLCDLRVQPAGNHRRVNVGRNLQAVLVAGQGKLTEVPIEGATMNIVSKGTPHNSPGIGTGTLVATASRAANSR